MPDAPSHLVFVDFENSPEIDLALIERKSAHVTILIGKNQAKIPTDLSIQFNRFASQVRLIRLNESGHNALDLTLAYYLGQSAQQWHDAEFHVVSKDTDFGPMIRHLAQSKLRIRRSDTFSQLPFLDSVKPAVRAAATTKSKQDPAPPKPTQDRSAKLIARLTHPSNRNRPTTEKALRAHIKTALGKDAADGTIEETFDELIEKGLSIQVGGKLVWADAAQL